MKIGKQARRDAKDLFLACKRDGVLDETRVRQTVTQVLASTPRNCRAGVTHCPRPVELDIPSRTVRIENAVPAAESLMADLKTSLTGRYGAGLDFQFFVDPTLIGGLRIRIGSDVFDGTVKTRLASLENSF